MILLLSQSSKVKPAIERIYALKRNPSALILFKCILIILVIALQVIKLIHLEL